MKNYQRIYELSKCMRNISFYQCQIICYSIEASCVSAYFFKGVICDLEYHIRNGF